MSLLLHWPMDRAQALWGFELLAQSRVESAYFVLARGGKNASAPASSARRRAISRRSQLVILGPVGLRELFLPILGNWTGVEEQAASPWAPATTARAMIVFKLDVGDQVVLQDYRQVRADRQEFSGHGVFMIDSADVMSPASWTSILWWFFDSYGYPPQPAQGGWRDGELIMQKTTPRGMAEHRFAVAGDQLTYRIRLQLDDTPEMDDFLSGAYRRISGH
jgi:hypothetical protein